MGLYGRTARLAAEDHPGKVPADQETLRTRPQLQVGGGCHGPHPDPGAVRRQRPVVVVVTGGRLLFRGNNQPLAYAGRARDIPQPGLRT